MAIHPSNIAPAHAMRSEGERVKSQLGMGVGERKKVCIKIILTFFSAIIHARLSYIDTGYLMKSES